MEFFHKIKKMVKKTGVELDYKWIENPFPFSDPMIKATLRISASEEISVLSSTGTFYAQRTDSNGMQKEIVLGEDECSDIAKDGDYQKFPQTIEAGGIRTCAFFLET
jgi:hypothetical protein